MKIENPIKKAIENKRIQKERVEEWYAKKALAARILKEREERRKREEFIRKAKKFFIPAGAVLAVSTIGVRRCL